MAKFQGVIGYVRTVQTSPGVYKPQTTERPCTGDIIANTQRWEEGSQVNDNLRLSNRFSIVANPYLETNQQYIKYLTYKGTKWKVSSIEIKRPRIILTVGGVYNGQ